MEKSSKKLKSFEVGEKLFCYHGPLLYEAKLLKIDDSNENEFLYFIHYNGWNKNYDEWVNSKRILKINEKSIKLKEELVKTTNQNNKSIVNNGAINSNNNSNSSSSSSSSSGSNCSNNNKSAANSKSIVNDNSKKRKLNNADTSSNESDTGLNKKYEIINPNQEFDQYLTNQDFKINISNELKEILLDDWDFVIHQNKLLNLPCAINVMTILNDYISSKSSDDDGQKDLIETIEELKEYFNVMLASQLLYKFERIQYMQILSDYSEKEMSEIYGFVHLLRLFAKLSSIISFTPLEETSLRQLMFYIHDILKFLEIKHGDYYNDSNYILAIPEYVRSSIC